MMKAYVGLASAQGLAVLQPEGDETRSFVRRCVRGGAGRVGFWAVLDDAAARLVTALLRGGRAREALHHLDRSARELGRL